MENYIKFLLCIHSLSIIGISANPMIAGDALAAQKPDFPFVVSLGDAPANEAHHHFCTGTLISSRHVLTTKQCLLGGNGRPEKDLAQVTVTIGSIDMTHGAKYGIVGRSTTYEDYLRHTRTVRSRRRCLLQLPFMKQIRNLRRRLTQRNLRHDLTVVTLDRRVNPNRATPAPLTDFTDQQLHCRVANAMGWGATIYHIHWSRLQTQRVGVYTREAYRNERVAENNLFTLIDIPPGYHGGPLVVDGKLAGVITNVQGKLNVMQHASANYYRHFIEHFGRNETPVNPARSTRHRYDSDTSSSTNDGSRSSSNFGSES